MKVKLEGFIPHPLAENFKGASDVWLQQELQLNSCHTTLVVSESGKGKSSLISSLYGLRKDYNGIISFDGTNISSFNNLKWSKLREDKISIVFQGLKLFPELTVWDNIRVKNKLTNNKRNEELEEILERLNILEYKNQQVKTLSYGQKQRVAIARALCQSFELILLDEPFSHLDDENAKQAWLLIKEYSDKQNADIIITALGATEFIHSDQTLNL